MSKFELYEMDSIPMKTRQQSNFKDPMDSSIGAETQSMSTLDTLMPVNSQFNIDDDLNIDELSIGSEDDDSLNFELYGDGISRERLIRQLTGVETENFSEFLLDNYKYWSLDDLSTSLGDLLKGLDVELINLVNSNYLHYINLDKSIDGSLDLTHDIKIDLNSYLKVLKNENTNIDNDVQYVTELQGEKGRLMFLRFTCETIIKLNELIECFDGLVNKFDLSKHSVINEEGSTHGSRTHMLLELTGMYFAITRIFINLISNDQVEKSKIVINLGRRMNGLKLEFSGLLSKYVKELKVKVKEGDDSSRVELFEVFKVYQLLNSNSEFKGNVSKDI